MPRDLLLFLAIVPEEDIQAEVTAFKEYAREHFESGHALKSPPHITLIPPFRWPPGRLPALKKALEAFAAGYSSFELALDGFDCFRPRVIFVDVRENEDLRRLQADLERELKNGLELTSPRNHGFHPHMTIAFKDLRRSVFPRAWAHFSQRDYQRAFEAGGFHLLRHNGRRWELAAFYRFGS